MNLTGPQRCACRTVLMASVVLVGFMRMAAMPDDVREFDKVLPEKIDGWSKAAPPDVYTPESLSNYIDGGAELYLSYGFKNALSLKYKDAADQEIAVDIFDMGTSHDAFGVFAHSRETIDTSVGQGSEYAAGLLTFWKGRYYVSILAYPETAAKKEIVFKLGRAIAGAVPADGPLPPILGSLPAENLLAETVHYFHHYIWLNSFYFLSNDNVLDIGNDTPAALAKYRASGSVFFLLAVRYPDPSRAAAAAGRFRESVLGDGASAARALKGGRWTGIRCRGTLVGVVFGAPDETTVRTYLDKIKD
jgi:hypothetical protein